jgi:tRNA (guanine37-N1)-methyltransferase
MSPRGKTFNQKMAEAYTQLDELVIICGHYEGIDERVNNYVDELVSTGDYVLTGGEIPSMLIVDSVVRLLDGVIRRESIIDESFESGMLEYPQYTEPRVFEGHEVPEILYSGNHGKIDRYRYLQALKITKEFRPDLFEKLEVSTKDLVEMEELD